MAAGYGIQHWLGRSRFPRLNSLIYYVIMAWLPTILNDSGYSTAMAGSLHGVSQLASAVAGLFFGPVVGRLRDQKALAVGVSALTGLSMLGFLLAPAWALLWTALFGLGAGATFILGLAFISLRAANSRQAAALSGMAQCLGYLLAAGGPPLAGFSRNALGSWDVPLIGCFGLCIGMAVFGYFAGRPLHIPGKDRLDHQTPASSV